MRRAVVLTLLLTVWLAGTASASTYLTLDAPSPLVDTTQVGGTVSGAPRSLKVGVLLPDGYAAHPHRSYPVLWLLHGASFDYRTWVEQQHIADAAKGMNAIIVMPDGGRFGMYTDWYNDGAFGRPQWLSYELGPVRRLITKRFRIRPGRRWHAIAGISMGGQGTLRLAALLPGYFGSAAGFSAALPNLLAPEVAVAFPLIVAGAGGTGVTFEDVFGPASSVNAQGMNPQTLAGNYANTRLYLASGDGVNCPEDPVNPQSIAVDMGIEAEIRNQQGPFADAARAAGAQVTTRETCGVHTFGVWSRDFDDARDNWGFFRAVPNLPTVWNYTTSARTGDAWGVRFRAPAPPTALLHLEHDAHTLHADGAGELTVDGGRGCRFTATLPFTRSCR